MTNIQLKFLLGSILLFHLSISFAEYGVASFVRGKAFVDRSDQKDIPLRKNDKVLESDVIRTLKKSFVKITFSDNSTFALGQNSKVVMAKLKVDEMKNIELLQGYVRSKFNKEVSKDHKIQVKTKSAILGIRGTEFSMIYNPKNNVTAQYYLMCELCLKRST